MAKKNVRDQQLKEYRKYCSNAKTYSWMLLFFIGLVVFIKWIIWSIDNGGFWSTFDKWGLQAFGIVIFAVFAFGAIYNFKEAHKVKMQIIKEKRAAMSDEKALVIKHTAKESTGIYLLKKDDAIVPLGTGVSIKVMLINNDAVKIKVVIPNHKWKENNNE